MSETTQGHAADVITVRALALALHGTDVDDGACELLELAGGDVPALDRARRRVNRGLDDHPRSTVGARAAEMLRRAHDRAEHGGSVGIAASA